MYTPPYKILTISTYWSTSGYISLYLSPRHITRHVASLHSSTTLSVPLTSSLYLPQGAMNYKKKTTSTPDATPVPIPTTGRAVPNERSPLLEVRFTVLDPLGP